MENEEKIRKKARHELEVLDIYIEEVYARFNNPDENRVLMAACTAYLSAGLSDIDGSVEGLYEKIDGI
ncbi:hypothetical protein K7G42_03955 [Streptococcus parauberis]|uniref:Phage protein n=1 Tax=Streptococcus parauberis KRS-02083 TaxID=1207545 RepID=A0ABP2T1C7_9STRE|nr:hypothetical protein [Streptococcus parauberis]EMG26278.1 hypothetical protein SPJ1_0240 [Streptococcus parauberis KRS-02083]QBX18124.1 hypothetical protein Javan393_0044 [Streptococcus phage Javan393]WEM65786.1 hypothetical protein P1T45_04035 [Streptococcus parauberis]WOF47666.1 hypothetical protein K7G42_03955 [Streptococcus parauberis]